jgi:hypothetical protein
VVYKVSIAFLQVEHVIKEQNMFDVYVMIEDYCNLLIERLHLVEQERYMSKKLHFFPIKLVFFFPLFFYGAHLYLLFIDGVIGQLFYGHASFLYRECPDELKEAISGLIYAASRVGDFPELQEIRSTLTSRFGKEFAARAIDLRNNCGVNLKVYPFR